MSERSQPSASQIVVLGSGGYLGSEVMRALRRQGVQAIGMRALPRGEHPQATLGPGHSVVNCIGYYGPDVARLREANVEQARFTAEATREAGAALVHVSSSAVFDGIRRGQLAESTPPGATTPYGRSKAEGEQAVLETHPHARVVRPSKLFGGHDPRGRLSSLLRHVAAGRPLPVPQQPALYANFVWVRPAAAALAREAITPAGQRVLHLATPCQWACFVDLLGTALDRPVRTAPQPIGRLFGAAAGLLSRTGRPLPRQLERLVELWDEREFVDSAQLIPQDCLGAGLAVLAGKET